MHEPSTAGQTFDLHGTETFNREQLLALVERFSHQKPRTVYLPRRIMEILATVRSKTLYWHMPGWTPDEVVREHIDHVPSTTGPNGEKVLGWEDIPGMTRLEPLDGLVVKIQLKNFQRGLDSTPMHKKKTEVERARQAEMNRLL